MILAASVQVKINQEQLNQQLGHERIFMDVEKLSVIMSVSLMFLEEHILQNPRIKVFERGRSRKKLYMYSERLSKRLGNRRSMVKRRGRRI